MTTISKRAIRCFALVAAIQLSACGGPLPSGIDENGPCYALTVGAWSVVPDYGIPMPNVIELARSRNHPWRRWLPNDTGYHVARGWRLDGSPSPAFDLWRRTEGDSIKVGPFLRFTGYRLMLKDGDPPLSGTVTYHTDAVPPNPPPTPRATVVARPTSCPASSEDQPR